MKPEITRIDPPAIVKLDTRRADELRDRVQLLGKTIAINNFELGEALHEIKTNDYWANYGESFEDYLKKDGIDISPRQAYYLIQIHKVSTALNLGKDTLILAGTSKLKHIMTLDPDAVITDPDTGEVTPMADVIRHLVATAPAHTVKEVREKVEAILNVGTDEDDQLTWMNLPVRRSAKKTVLDAIEMARALSGDTLDPSTGEFKDVSDAIALERICADFISDPNNVPEEFGDRGDFADEEIFADTLLHADTDEVEVGLKDPADIEESNY
jgi:hypothetical protein